MLVIPLIENREANNLFPERGLSLYIETNENKIIVDTGRSELFLNNLEKIGISINEIDYFVISHGHSDHFGQIHKIEKLSCPIYVAKESFNNFYSESCGVKKSIGSYKNIFKNISKNFRVLDFQEKYKISENIFLIKSIKKDLSWNFKIENEQDTFNHEIHLVVIEDDMANIITGCCHCGVLNLLHSVKEFFPDKKINSLIGGLHTRSYIFRPLKLIKLILGLKKYNINKLILGHCTGQITEIILSKFVKNISPLKMGKRFHIKGTI